jgi:hypothetical protein
MPRASALLITLAGICFSLGCSPKCTPAVCPDGCCDFSDVCRGGGSQSACGTHGTTCQACGSTQQCVAGTCQTSSMQQCNGVTCTGGDVCINGTCTPPGAACNASNCSLGCCDGGTCIQAYQQLTACGLHGGACTPCTDSSSSCQNGVCVNGCGPGTCPIGCCQSSTCISPNTDGYCGLPGVACRDCRITGACANGSCYCGQTGCIDSFGGCDPGTGPAACGTGGGACVACASNQLCVDGGCQ